MATSINNELVTINSKYIARNNSLTIIICNLKREHHYLDKLGHKASDSDNEKHERPKFRFCFHFRFAGQSKDLKSKQTS